RSEPTRFFSTPGRRPSSPPVIRRSSCTSVATRRSAAFCHAAARTGASAVGHKASQAVIGAFVLGAVLLAVGGVVVLSGDRLFRDTQTVVAYFDGSLEGLDIGAPVTFNGVKIGSVTDLKVVIDPRDESIRTPVFFKI